MPLKRPNPNDKITRQMIRKLERMEESGHGDKTTNWEKGFIGDVKDKLTTFGTAFIDQEKGDLERNLSYRQYFKMQEIKRQIRHRANKSKPKVKRPSKIVPRNDSKN